MRFLVVFLAWLPLVAAAETAYVTDKLRLGLHQAPDTSDRAFRMLESGQQLEVLFRDGNYASVPLPDGVQGHVKAAYLVTEKPARLVLAETEAERDALRAELEQAREALAAPEANIAALRNQVDDLTSRLEQAQARTAALERERTDIADLRQRFRGSLPLTWVGAATAVCLVAGFLVGIWWVDRQNRRRHGGIRVY